MFVEWITTESRNNCCLGKWQQSLGPDDVQSKDGRTVSSKTLKSAVSVKTGTRKQQTRMVDATAWDEEKPWLRRTWQKMLKLDADVDTTVRRTGSPLVASDKDRSKWVWVTIYLSIFFLYKNKIKYTILKKRMKLNDHYFCWLWKNEIF